jgi:hypothetical protein
MSTDHKILLKNTEKSLEFIVRTQDFFSSKARENHENLIKVFRNTMNLLLESLGDSLEGLNKQMEVSTKESQNVEILEREVKRLNREEVFAKDEERELKREIENRKEAKLLLEKENERKLNE